MAALDNQEQPPASFVWVNDVEVELNARKLATATTGIESLMMPPNGSLGLTPENIETMRK